MGYNPLPFPITFEKTDSPTADQRLDILSKTRVEAMATHELARQLMAERSKRGFRPFKKGQQVWLEAKNLNVQGINSKLVPKRQGPFFIKDVLSNLNYHCKG